VVDLACSDGLLASVNDIHWTLARLFKYGLVTPSEDRRQSRPRG